MTKLDQLLLFEAEPDDLCHPADAQEVLNYVRAAEFGLAGPPLPSESWTNCSPLRI